MTHVKRAYDGSRRREQARARRLAVVQAARELFEVGGFRQTTIAAIAKRAGVSSESIYKTFGTKAALAKAVFDLELAGDDEPVPIPQRTWYVQTLAQSDPVVLLRMQSGNNRRILERVAALELVIRATGADPALATLAAEARRQRRFGAATITGRLHELGALRPGLTHEAAGDIYYAIASPEVFMLLTHDQGWSGTAYEEWLADQLIYALVGRGDGAIAAAATPSSRDRS